MINVVQERGVHPPGRCPGCGTPTPPDHLHGGASYCLPCTEEDIGESYEQLRDRITAKTAKKKKWNVV